MPQLSINHLKQTIKTLQFGQNLVYQPQTGSTNTDLKALAQTGAPAGTLYLTDEQLTGRGRLGRQWHAPAGSSLLMSLLFRPDMGLLLPHQTQRLTMVCSLALLEAIEAQAHIKPFLKWPNDVVWRDGRKLAGILTEFELDDHQQLAWVIVGMGLNISVDFSHVATSDPLTQTAVSLSMLTERPLSREALVVEFLQRVETRYMALTHGELPHTAWADHLLGIGEMVTVSHMDGSQMAGRIQGVDADGGLLLQPDVGDLLTVWAGDVTLRKPK